MIVGISGPSGSGKTTIARALRQLYSTVKHQTVQILHQDDFYKPEKDIPLRSTRSGDVVNWDCADALDMAALKRTLKTYREHNHFPEELREELMKRAKEDQNDSSPIGVSADYMRRVISEHRLPVLKTDLLIVDGFMLYEDPDLCELFDVRILLRGSFAKLQQRREARSGYATLEGFWKDPAHYFEDVVWPEYINSHKRFFLNGNVEGSVEGTCSLQVAKPLDMTLDESMSFVLGVVEYHTR